MHNTLYISGAGVSAESGIPTFRGKEGFWTIGSRHYTPMEMATRRMYMSDPGQFLAWYYQRFAVYRHHGPNDVHRWLADKNLITQNIDGLDGKAGNQHYIAIHGRLDQMTLFHEQGPVVDTVATPWDNITEQGLSEESDPLLLQNALLALFNIDPETAKPELNHSYKPFVLLFDEYYTDLYRISEAQNRMLDAEKIIFMGTSFSVNITQMALEIAIRYRIPVEVVDPNPVNLAYDDVRYHKMTALEYIQQAP
ncbi:MAG: SIR2 family NAD-dependent protein deacylase [Oleiphilus sp.]